MTSFAEAWLAVTRRRARTLLLGAGVLLGLTAFAATVTLTASARATVGRTFDGLRADILTLTYPAEVPAPGPADLRRLDAVPGVLGAARVTADPAPVDVSRLPAGARSGAGDTGSGTGTDGQVLYADGAADGALSLPVVAGRWFDAAADARSDAVAVVEENLARAIGLPSGRLGPPVGAGIWLDGRPFTVIGIYRADGARGLGAVVLPWSRRPADLQTQVVVRTVRGRADPVAQQTPRVLSPRHFDRLVVAVDADPAALGRAVDADLGGLLIGLGAMSLVVGALSVGNVMTVNVLERRSEIGLRRAVGASRADVARMFLAESAIVGLFFGLLAAVLAVDIGFLVAEVKGWRLVLDPVVILSCPGLGLITGLVGGGLPAFRAAAVPPSVTLRGL